MLYFATLLHIAFTDDSEPDSDVSDSSGTSDSSDSSASEEAANEENQSGNEELTVGDLLANLKTKSPKVNHVEKKSLEFFLHFFLLLIFCLRGHCSNIEVAIFKWCSGLFTLG